jgi:transmembrane sensor
MSIEDWNEFGKEDIRTLLDVVRVEAKEKLTPPDVEKELDTFWENRRKADAVQRRQRLTMRWRLAAAAASVALVLGVFLTYVHSYNAQEAGQANIIYAAKKNAAFLRVEMGGRTYLLTDASAGRQTAALNMTVSGSDVRLHRATGRRNTTETMTTPCGKIITLTLSDGTVVKLNAASSITFPQTFSGRERVVRLRGEAFFEVKHDARHPFVVQTDYFRTTVLGTHFNITAYSPSRASVTLIEGKVRVQNRRSNALTLAPEEQAVFLKGGSLGKQKADIYPCLQWQKGFFYFDETPLQEILLELGRWYNIDIQFRNKKALDEKMHFIANRNEGIQKAIDNLNELGLFHIIFVNNKMVVE